MQITNANQYPRPNDPAWFFLAEFLLSDFFVDHHRKDELTGGLLFQAVRELGMPPEWVENIEMMLAEFANKALAHFKQGELELPGRIRVFCQKKIIDEANSARAASPAHPQEQAEEPTQIVHNSGAETNGGWGYFLIGRGEGFSAYYSSTVARNSIDLYLYKEGG